MSNQTTQNEQGQPAQGRQPGGGRRSGGSRNRNRNRNRDGNRGGNRNGGNRGGGGQGRKPSRRPEPKPVPLTLWQKLLKAVGLYNPKKRSSPSRVPKPAEARPSAGRPKRQPKQGERKPVERKREVPSTADVDTKRLYLGNLSYEVTEYELEDLFKGIGPVRDIEIVYNRNTHKSKGYGFAEMQTIEDAKRAVEVLHDQPFMGRNLIVNAAKSSGPQGSDESEASNETARSEASNEVAESEASNEVAEVDKPGEA